MTTNNNPLLCDPESGICEIPGAENTSKKQPIAPQNKPVKIIYFTDPICSSCWGIEPQLRRLKLEYGHDVEFEYHMGGLLPDWSYNSGGINKPSDVAHHWDEVSLHYKMPINGNIWLEDPLDSSYPPSIAFKAAQLQNEEKAVIFLRSLREMVFLQKKNITRWEIIAQAAIKAGLDVVQLKQDYEGKAKELFQADLSLSKKMGIRGFPSIFVTNSTGGSEFIYGTKPYLNYENAIQKICPSVIKKAYKKDWQSLFEKYPTLTLREFVELSEISFQEAEQTLETLVETNKIKKLVTKNGALWIK
ncbi:DsbA family protein [Emticicia sp. BO119]|nr:DsbA family protein [Emticicia sp. BO119]